jgi:hypothetical protein
MNKRHILTLVLFSLGIKVFYLAISIAVHGYEKDLYSEYVSIAKKFDSHWYEKIATKGYSEIRKREDIGFSDGKNFKQSEWAFFPFYPLLNISTMNLFDIDFDTSALIWSLILSIISILGTYWFGLIHFKSHQNALFNSLLLFCFPFTFYFSFFYTEALFLLVVVFSFISIHYERYFLLMILLVPLSLLRPNGIVVLLPLYLYHLEQRGILLGFKMKWKEIFGLTNIKQSLFFISSPIAFLLYCLYQYKMTGFYFAFMIAQKGWHKEFMFPLLSFFRRGDLATYFNSIFTIGVIIYAIWTRKKLPLSLNLLVLLSILLPLTAGSVTSMPRYISVIFPLFLTLTLYMTGIKNKYIALAMLILLHFVSYYGWVINHHTIAL